MVSATWLLVAKFTPLLLFSFHSCNYLAPFYALLLLGHLDIFPPLFIIVILILFKHKNNITRLIDGIEPKIKFKHSVIEEIMDDEPSAAPVPLIKETTATTVEVVKVPKATKAAVVKAKTVKKTGSKAEKPMKKAAKPAKKPVATQAKQPKEK